MDDNKITTKTQRIENIAACKVIFKAQIEAKAAEKQLRDTFT
jgi:hypothetical protein